MSQILPEPIFASTMPPFGPKPEKIRDFPLSSSALEGHESPTLPIQPERDSALRGIALVMIAALVLDFEPAACRSDRQATRQDYQEGLERGGHDCWAIRMLLVLMILRQAQRLKELRARRLRMARKVRSRGPLVCFAVVIKGLCLWTFAECPMTFSSLGLYLPSVMRVR